MMKNEMDIYFDKILDICSHSNKVSFLRFHFFLLHLLHSLFSNIQFCLYYLIKKKRFVMGVIYNNDDSNLSFQKSVSFDFLFVVLFVVGTNFWFSIAMTTSPFRFVLFSQRLILSCVSFFSVFFFCLMQLWVSLSI